MISVPLATMLLWSWSLSSPATIQHPMQHDSTPSLLLLEVILSEPRKTTNLIQHRPTPLLLLSESTFSPLAHRQGPRDQDPAVLANQLHLDLNPQYLIWPSNLPKLGQQRRRRLMPQSKLPSRAQLSSSLLMSKTMLIFRLVPIRRMSDPTLHVEIDEHVYFTS
jgi:hypothetical protein